MTNDESLPANSPPPSAAVPGPVPRWRAALAGVAAAAAALATGELVAGLLPGSPSPLAAVGAAVIDYAPPGSKDLMVSLFGTADKLALGVFITAIVLLAGAALGLVARRNLAPAAIGIAAIAGVGALAGLRLPTAAPAATILSAALQAGVGIQVLVFLLATAPVRTGSPDGGRRGFLLRAGTVGALAVVGGGVGRALLEGRATANASAGTGGTGATGGNAGATAAPLPGIVDPAPTPPPDASLTVDGITPLVIANEDFYRIDTALVTPSVDVATWKLRVFGMVDREIALSMDDLLELPLIERYVTIACVSNEVGGDLIGNAKWTGVRLTDVLEMAGVQPGATQIVPRSVDGWTAGFPTAWITDPANPRDALIAVRMNDQPLPALHGFPARLIVPGLFGYVSATKWVKELELTTMEAFDAYWVPRGWAKEAPILTQSRIDTPRRSSALQPGPVPVAGVAWAPDRGISRVEVSVDGGEWNEATLATAIGPQTWVQWQWAWQATSGDHTIAVRATDGNGEVQTADLSRPDPDGARGHHQVSVRVA
ncbi:MAG: molybdopterin-dependent oxidoreductase [Chloroflexi bacterium]|nr:molybdopterin-dependent oxidoreductase [Chloroflexota bacterium]